MNDEGLAGAPGAPPGSQAGRPSKAYGVVLLLASLYIVLMATLAVGRGPPAPAILAFLTYGAAMTWMVKAGDATSSRAAAAIFVGAPSLGATLFAVSPDPRYYWELWLLVTAVALHGAVLVVLGIVWTIQSARGVASGLPAIAIMSTSWWMVLIAIAAVT